MVVASDNAYLYENLEQQRPIAQTLDSVSNLAAQRRMLRLAGDISRVVPGHDERDFAFARIGLVERDRREGSGWAAIELLRAPY